MSYRDDFRYVQKEATWTFWKVLWLLIAASAVLGVVGFVFTMLSRPAAVVDQVTQPERIISNYEWYRESYNDALAIDGKIQATQQQIAGFADGLPDNRNEWNRSDREEYNRLNSVLLGLRTQRENIVSDYNARSQMITRNLFKGAGVPYQLTIRDDKVREVWVK